MNNTETKQCKKCKEEINKKAKKCPKCGAKQGLPVWLIVIIVIIAIGIIGSVNGDSEESNTNSNANTNANTSTNTSTNTKANDSEKQETIEYITVSKDDLDEALENNAAVAKDTYNKKYVEITGKLGDIDSDLKYISLMSSSDEWDIIGIHCDIKSDAQKEVIKTLTKDQEITVRGRITDVGEFLGYYLDITEIIAN